MVAVLASVGALLMPRVSLWLFKVGIITRCTRVWNLCIYYNYLFLDTRWALSLERRALSIFHRFAFTHILRPLIFLFGLGIKFPCCPYIRLPLRSLCQVALPLPASSIPICFRIELTPHIRIFHRLSPFHKPFLVCVSHLVRVESFISIIWNYNGDSFLQSLRKLPFPLSDRSVETLLLCRHTLQFSTFAFSFSFQTLPINGIAFLPRFSYHFLTIRPFAVPFARQAFVSVGAISKPCGIQ